MLLRWVEFLYLLTVWAALLRIRATNIHIAQFKFIWMLLKYLQHFLLIQNFLLFKFILKHLLWNYIRIKAVKIRGKISSLLRINKFRPLTVYLRLNVVSDFGDCYIHRILFSLQSCVWIRRIHWGVAGRASTIDLQLTVMTDISEHSTILTHLISSSLNGIDFIY